jgi:hypothetical protein
MSMLWFIDSWDVVDGMAFASQRKMGSTDASATVYIAAPHFDPEPVASIATALAATRNHFQWGFFGEDGNEIGFTSLGHVQEAVRRGYLGGGAGGGGFGPDEGGPPDLPEGPSPLEGGPRTRESLTGPYLEEIDIMLRKLDSLTRGKFALLLADSLSFGAAEVLRRFAGECLQLMAVRFQNEKDRRPAWLKRILQLSALCDTGGLSHSFPNGSPLLDEWSHWHHRHYLSYPYNLGYNVVSYLAMKSDPFGDLLYWVPLPREYQKSRTDTVGSLGDHLARALADPTYNEGKDPLCHLIPLLFGAFLIAARGGDIYAAHVNDHSDPKVDLLRNTIRSAADWLAQELPGRELDPRVEVEIARMVSERIGLYHRRQLSPTGTAEISAQ